jgi:hypothetical protein
MEILDDEEDYGVVDKQDLGFEASMDQSLSLEHQVDDMFQEQDDDDVLMDEDVGEELHVLSQSRSYPADEERYSSEDHDHDQYLQENEFSDNNHQAIESKTSPMRSSSKNQHRYQHPLAKPVLEAGSIQMGIGKARLYGLVDPKGNVKLPASVLAETASAEEIAKNKVKSLSKVNDLHSRKDIDIEGITAYDEKPTFHPSRSKEAERAMKNPRLGYDFLTRLRDETTDSVLERLTQTTAKKGMSKSALESMEEDYNAKLDKLTCPQCKKSQSFAEVLDKRRFCSQCNQRFVKVNVTSGLQFINKVALHESKRQQKIASVEDEMYGEMTRRREMFKGKPVPKFVTQAAADKKLVESQLKIISEAKGRVDDSSGSSNQVQPTASRVKDTRPQPPARAEAKAEAKAYAVADAHRHSNAHDPKSALLKLAEVNQKNSSLLRQTIAAAEQKYQPQPATSTSKARTTIAPGRSKTEEAIAQKLKKLVK